MHLTTLAPLAVGSVAAKVVARVWSGEAGTLVSAAPGAGKTAMIVDVLTHLVMRAGLKVVVATPTREQGYGVTARLHQAIPKGYLKCGVKNAAHHLPAHIHGDTRELDDLRAGSGSVTVMTIEGVRYSRNTFDLMVVDEGYQATFSSLASAAVCSTQLLVVGDSGQIGPVVSEDVSAFESWRATPHFRAPDVLATREDFETFHLGTSYRLGQETVDVVGLLYPFPLSSGRPHRELTTERGLLPEIETIDMGAVTDLNDMDMLRAAVDRAIECSQGQRFDGDVVDTFPMSDHDVAIVVSRNTQLSLIRGMLDSAGHPGITVGTANKLQGGQWSAVVAIDPLAGVLSPGERDVTTGLLCVMISRHTTHMTWVHADGWTEAMNAATDTVEKQKGLAVRQALVSKGRVDV